MSKLPIKNILLYLSYILVLVASVIYLPYRTIAPYLMAVGAIGLLVFHLMERPEGTSIRQQRNNRTRHLIGVIYAVSAYFMFQEGRYWIIALMVAAVLEIYTLSVRK